MTVLNLLEKVAQDSQIIIDVFVNYDCDVDAPNIYERCLQDCKWPFKNCARSNPWFNHKFVFSPGHYF
uniref:Uncharacterized protein MANES_03G096700 n=1 Tax=Rhizophora mucronata TaxID=61149 RepID=A0A2P2LZ96_RHIMU